MALAPPRPCKGSPARRFCRTVTRDGRCPDCARAYDLQRGTAVERGYDGRWAGISKRHLKAYPLCGMRAPDAYEDGWRGACHDTGRIRKATCTDHIRPHKGDRELLYDPRNRQSMCGDCNRIKAIRYEGGFGRAPVASVPRV